MPTLKEIPHTIYIPVKNRCSSRSLMSGTAGSSGSSEIGTPEPTKPCLVRMDYMQVPSCFADQLGPIFPWLQTDDVQERSTLNNNCASSPSSNRHRLHPQATWHRPLVAFVLFVTLALAAGTLLDDGQETRDRNSTPKTTGKQRGQYLPAAHSRPDTDQGIRASMFDIYQSLKQEYHSKAFQSPPQAWKVLNEKDGAKVSLMEHASDPTCPYVRMETTIPTSVASCWEFLSIHNWNWSMPKMDPFYDTHTVYSNLTHHDVNMILVRKQTHRILAFGKRDFVFLSVSDVPLEDGTFVSGTVSVETPDVPRDAHYTRAFQDSVAFYKPVIDPESGEENCHLTIVCRIDLNDSTDQGTGGFVPMWLYVKTVGATGIKSVLKMKNALMEMKQEQDNRLMASAPTSASTAMPPTQSPTLIKIMDSTKASNRPNDRMLLSHSASTTPEPNKNRLADRPRGGAAFVTISPPIQQTTFSSSVDERWKPLYQVFTHIPPKEGPPPRNGKFGLQHLHWLHRVVPIFGHRRGKSL